MKTTSDLVKELKQHGVLIIEDHMKHTLPDLTFTLDCMCITYSKREIESTKLGRVVRIRMMAAH
ncbi:hypothetical protein HOS33_gp313 [Erwinia phage vB_EamM_Y3]|uniref:Uncharacterized protein n=1 Tax=Erwinia phage vB_EamM_Y3 TaxID=1983553 RepID=A0A2H4IBL4_9CAUD|nr:hypothetical protein HOS33_gp313 [Erwinia phage vB_EamM_Y3]ARW58953.1 hypothetical protein Y3_313 [Erwinia phage vB_EamM_Y3]